MQSNENPMAQLPSFEDSIDGKIVKPQVNPLY